MRQFALKVAFITAIAACGLTAHSQADQATFHTNDASRRCVRRLDLDATGFMRRGVSVSFNEYPAAKTFSDEWIELQWVVENHAVHARITNKAKTPIVIDGATVGAEKQRTAIEPFQLAPHSSHDVPVASLGQVEKLFTSPRSTAAPNLHLEICMRVAQEECSYRFQLATTPSNSTQQLSWPGFGPAAELP